VHFRARAVRVTRRSAHPRRALARRRTPVARDSIPRKRAATLREAVVARVDFFLSRGTN
jgi:hypothetical protein